MADNCGPRRNGAFLLMVNQGFETKLFAKFQKFSVFHKAKSLINCTRSTGRSGGMFSRCVGARQIRQCSRAGDGAIVILSYGLAPRPRYTTRQPAGPVPTRASSPLPAFRSRALSHGRPRAGRAFAHRNRNAFGFRPQRRVPVDRRPPARRVRRGRQRQRRIAGQPAFREQPRHGRGHEQRRLWTERRRRGVVS